MKEEDMDWLVYHRIPEGETVSAEALAAKCGLGIPEVDASLARLEQSCLQAGARGEVLRVFAPSR